MTKKMKKKVESRLFTLWKNEGSFFDEPWLHDVKDNKDYRYDCVPSHIKKAFAQELRDRGRMSPEEAWMIIGWLTD